MVPLEKFKSEEKVQKTVVQHTFKSVDDGNSVKQENDSMSPIFNQTFMLPKDKLSQVLAKTASALTGY